MSWGLSWKRPPDSFRLTLSYGSDADHTLDDIYPTTITSLDDDNNPDDQLGYRIDLDWSVGDVDEQVALRLQSQAKATLPPPEDFIKVDLREGNLDNYSVEVVMEIVTRREPLKGVTLSRAGGSGQQNDGGLGVLLKLMKLDLASNIDAEADGNGIAGTGMENYVFADHWRNVSVVSLAGLGLNAFPIEITQLANLDKLYIDYNKLVALPPKIGSLRNLKVLVADYNFLVAVPVELRQCTGLLALSLEHNKLVRPLLDFRAMSELRVLRLFGNPLEFLPDILPLRELRHLSLPNICIIASQNLGSVDVQIEMENNSYFVGSRHKLSSLFSLIFRFFSCHHPLLSSALAKMMQDEENRAVVGKDETALRQLISMISSEDQHVVEQACSALSALASDFSVAMELVKLDIMQPIETVLKSEGLEKVISVLQVVVKLTFASDIVAYKMFAKNMLKTLKSLCAHKSPEVQKLSLFAIGNLAFCLENRQELVKSKSLLELLLHMTAASDSRVCKAAARVLAILGENELLSHAVRGKRVPKCGLRILTMDGGGMKGLATVKMLKEIEKGTGKQIHELFDLICGTSTGGMLAAALGIKLMSLEKCEEIYKELGKLVFADTAPKDNEAVTWRERLDQLYKSSSQSFRVAVHGSKHSACEFERLLKEMCADDDGDLLIESAVKRIPKVFIVSTLVSVSPAQPFVFRNYQYPAGTPEVSFPVSENMTNDGATAATIGAQIGYRRSTFMGSCKHQLWQAIRASSAAPYYLDDFSDGVCRWQDGAIVANNPTIFGIREAQLLWPDTKIDCLVSVGCGSTPAKVRKGGWRYLDTGQVLIESACSVERVEEALNALLAMLPDIKYFRFNPVDERCDMELDETDPTVWLQLENATAEYIQENSMAFTTLAENLLESRDEDNFSADLNAMHLSHGKAASNDNCPILGLRRGILIVEASQSSDSGNTFRHAGVLQTFCTDNRISLSHINIASLTAKTPLNSTCPPPRTSPLSTKRLPSTALPYSPGTTLKQVGEIDSISPVSFNGFQSSKIPVSPPDSPRRKPLPLSVVNLHEKINNLPQVGILHLALQNDTQGAILSWRNDVIVVAEPGELAEKFLQSAKLSLLYILNDTSRKHAASAIKNISTVAGLVSSRPNFQIGSIVHKYIGCQTHVMEDNQEISAYMFRRTIPYVHLIPEDVHSMVGDWRDRIIIFSGILGPTQALTKALLDSGAKAVVCPSSRPEEVQSMLMSSSNDLTSFDTGEEESKEKHIEKASNTSDFGNKDEHETNEEQSTFSGGNHERRLSNFIIKLYDSLYHGRDRADIALEKAAASHPGIKYTCHLPS